MKAIVTAGILATVFAPAVYQWFVGLPAAIRGALHTRAEVSALMAENYRRIR